MLIVFASYCYAIDVQQSSFLGQTNPFNISFVGGDNQSFILNIPQYSYAKNVSFVITNFLNLSNLYCYQETANSSFQNDQLCGQKYSGMYNFTGNFTNYNAMIDGDYSTVGIGQSTFSNMYVNYTIPNNITSAIFQSKTTALGLRNDTIPTSCLLNISLRLRVELYGQFVGASGNFTNVWCYDDKSNQIPILSSPDNSGCSLYEESIFWYTLGTYYNVSFFDNNKINFIQNYSFFDNYSVDTNRINILLNSSNPVVFNFYSNSSGTLQVSLLNATSSYGIDNCSNSFNIPSNATALNYTFKNETNQQTLQGSATGTITYRFFGGGTDNIIYPNIVNVSDFKYCIYPNWAVFSLDYNLNYNQFGSSITRQKSDSGVVINNILTTIPLYILGTDTSGTIRIRVTDNLNNNIVGATVVAIRTILGVPYTVQTAVTDSAGMVYLFLDTQQTYTIQASKTGFSTSSITIQPTTTDIYTISLSSGTTQQYSYSTGISYQFFPTDTHLVNNTDYNFGFNLSSTYWNITACSLSLLNSGTILNTQAGTFNATHCSDSFTYNSGNYSNLTLEATYSLNGTNLVLDQQYTVTNITTGQYSLLTIFKDIKALATSNVAGFDWRSLMLLTFVVIFSVTGFVAWKFNALINPEAVVVLQWALVFFFSIVGFISIPSGDITFPSIWGIYAGDYAIFIIDTIVSVSFVIWRLQ